MKKMISASQSDRMIDLFLKYHDDENNYHHNRSGFDKMYEILEKYDDSNGNDTVDVAFRKATPEDQKKMIELITPGSWSLKPSDKEYSRKLYYDALSGDAYEYRYANEAVVDVFDTLFASGWLNEEEFRTDL